MGEEIIPPGFRKCNVPTCGAILPETSDYFQKAPTGYKGLKRKCKQCSATQAEEYRRSHHEKVLIASRTYHKKESQQRLEEKQRFLAEHPPVLETERTCKDCGGSFPLTTKYFQRNPKSRGGFKLICKNCSNERQTHYRQEYQERVHQSQQEWREANREKINQKAREKHWSNREEKNRYERERRARNRAYVRQQARERYYTNHPSSLIQHKRWRERGKAHQQALFNRKMRAKGLKFCRICQNWWPTTREHFFVVRSSKNPHRSPFKGRCKHCFDLTLREKRRCNVRNRRARLRNIPGKHTAQDILDQYRRQRGRCYWCHTRMTKYHVDHLTPLNRPGCTNFPWNLVLSCPPCNESRGDRLPHEWKKYPRLL